MLTTLLAIYGAFLSSILAWLEYRKDRLLVHIRYDDFASKGLIDVSIENRSEADLVLSDFRVVFCKVCRAIVGESVRDSIASQLGGRSKLVRAGESCTVTFDLAHDSRARPSYFALISWRLRGLAAPTVPLVIRLPRGELENLAGSA